MGDTGRGRHMAADSLPPPATGTADDPSQEDGLSVKGVLRTLGPGLITGASDDDPSGIGTYSLAGAALGYATLWTALVTFPLMASIQLICARIGLVAKCGIAGVIRRHYSRSLLY